MILRRLLVVLLGLALGAYAQQPPAGAATPEQSQSIKLTPDSPTAWGSATIVAPGRGLNKYSICYVDTREFQNGGLLSVSIQIPAKIDTKGSFDIFTVEANGKLGQSLAGKYDIPQGSSTLLEYRFSRGQMFALTLEGNWFSPKGATGQVQFTASVSGSPSVTTPATRTQDGGQSPRDAPPVLKRAPAAPPQQQPSPAADRDRRIKEVTDWLSSKLSSSTGRSYQKTQGSSLVFARINEEVRVTFTGCKMTVQASFEEFYSYPGGTMDTFREGYGTIDFIDFKFAPFQTGVDDSFTSLGYVPQGRHWPWVSPGPSRRNVVQGDGIQTYYSTGSAPTNSSQNLNSVSFSFYVETDDLPNRIMTAVTELRRLCGAREEPF